MKTMIRFLRDEAGATSIEYALIACGIAVAIITVVNALGVSVNDKFESVRAAIN
jgi:pilus assembly protein Flp/PilA